MTHARKIYTNRRHRIDRDLPHQVALVDYMCTRENLDVIDDFCRQKFGEACPTRRVNTIWDDGHQEVYRLHCFADRKEAETFASHFGGEHFSPTRDREKGKVEGAWRRAGPWIRIVRCGSLELPDFWREKP